MSVTAAQLAEPAEFTAELRDAIRVCVDAFGGVVMIPTFGADDQVLAWLRRVFHDDRVQISVRVVDQVQFLRFDPSDGASRIPPP